VAQRVYDTKRWKDLRTFVLARDGYRCKTPGCSARATEVDHVVPIAKGGARYDPANLVARCKRHNVLAAHELAGAGWPADAASQRRAEHTPQPTGRRVWRGCLDERRWLGR
jgi:HNH endonuclease